MFHKSRKSVFKAVLLSGVCGLVAQAAVAQEAASANEEPEAFEEIIVVGSQIKGAKTTGDLPVTLMGQNDLDAIAATSGIELFDALPSNGVINFNGTDTVGGGVNSARGDVASINLRGIGSGNTLVLLNGRRVVQHPGTQTEDLVIVTTSNVNALPVSGIRRVEVLQEGASALYGSDAVAGVVNTIMRDNYEGYRIGAEYGDAENTSRSKLNIDFLGGWNLNDDKTNISLSLTYYNGSGVDATEFDRSASSDLRPLVEGTDFEEDTNFDNRSSSNVWGRFYADDSVSGLTTSSGQFHIEPVDADDSNQDCIFGNDLCLDSGAISRDQYYDSNMHRQTISDTERGNAFLFINHEFDNGMEFFSELSYYRSESTKNREHSSLLSSTPVFMSETAYYNPFGAVGSGSRLDGYTIPDEGLAIEIDRYRAIDADVRYIDVDNESYRALAGLRGQWSSWDWEGALLYSRAETNDTTTRISNSLFQEALNRTDSSAYNPFCAGLCNDQATIDSFIVDVSRINTTELASADFKLSNPAAFELFGNEVGAAIGVEWRYQSFSEDRDDRLDGTITFTDSVTDEEFGSDVMGSSPTADSSGDRHTFSAFGELAVPLVAYDADRTFLTSLDMQLAGRFEHYNDVGSVFKPKVALAWGVADGLKIRAAYTGGFRAPALEVVNTDKFTRVNTRTDYYTCLAAINKGEASGVDDCDSYSDSVESIRFGSDTLGPETTDNYSIGMVFAPETEVDFVITVDYWRIDQNNAVGILGDDVWLAYEAYAAQEGLALPDNIIRAAPTAEDIDHFDGSGLDAVGEVLNVLDPFFNLDKRRTEGLDISLAFKLDETAMGDFSFKLNASRLFKAQQTLSEEGTGGAIFLGDPTESRDLVKENGRPKWQLTSSVTWRNNGWGAGLWAKYTSSFYDPSAVQNDTGEYWLVDSWFRMNAYVQYSFDEGALDGTRIRIGARNIFDKEAPLADATYGYDSSLHSNEGRYWYASVRKTF
ncbi:TonB-dependent receptor domain-containing protein [Emcibacter sp.]|uniref:TonB-dependent receptor domain-containing protein n=1 Tax=Emcibacter sp. TaxID=1979954 RepID=UPI002AA8FA01|nr:TonB-dependent receptor [Emcibacter sp.]